MRRTFQFGNRVWMIDRVGKQLTTTWGVIAGKQQSKTKSYQTEGMAHLEQFKQARAKLKAGYVETTFRGDLPLGDPMALGLIESLAENPDDLAAHMAFADWLSEQSDDRLTAWGEFMRLQLAAEGQKPVGKRKDPDKDRLAELLAEYEIHWLGEELARPLLMDRDELPRWIQGLNDTGQREYRRGWLTTLRVDYLTESLARAMSQAEPLRLLRSLEVREGFDTNNVRRLAGAGVLGNVRELLIDSQNPRSDVVGLVRGLPRLEALYLKVYDLDPRKLFALPMPGLRTLEVVGPYEYATAKLAANPSLAGLRRLALNTCPRLESDDEPDDPGIFFDEDIATICLAPHLHGLKELALHYAEIDENGIQEIIDSRILARLEVLDLSNGNLMNQGASRLAACPDFARVRRVILDGNYLNAAMIRRLRQINKGVEAKDQNDPADMDFDDDWE